MKAPAERMDGYIRVSRRMGREGPGYISPSVQREAIERWASYKGVEIAMWHVDEDQSGGTHARPGLELAVERATTGETIGIVSWKIDRFSRYTEHGLRDLRRLEERDARLAFVVEDIDTSGPMGKFVYTVMLAMAEYFLDNIKAGWIAAKSRAVERGAKIGPTPFGYQHRDDGSLEPHPDEGPVVTETFKRAAYDGLDAAVNYLEAHTTRARRRVTTTTTRRLLANRAYLGEIRYGEMVATAAHVALTTPSMFALAQSEPRRRKPKAIFPLSGIARCAHCGGPMVGGRAGRAGRTVRTYRCAASYASYVYARGQETKCGNPTTVTAELLENYVIDFLVRAWQSYGYKRGQGNEDLEQRRIAHDDAEAELTAFATDLTARKRLGADTWNQALEMRAKARDAAKAAYLEALRAAAPQQLLVPTPDSWRELGLEELGVALRGALDHVLVQKGRGRLEGRVVLRLRGDDDLAGIARAQDAQPRALKAVTGGRG